MARARAALLAVLLLPGLPIPAVCDPSRAASAFVEVPLSEPPQRSHLLAYLTLAVGAGMVGGSFGLGQQANDAYENYLAATDPADITRTYERTVRYDRWSSAVLVTGEALVATAVYLRFLRRGENERVAVALSPGRCALSYRF